MGYPGRLRRTMALVAAAAMVTGCAGETAPSEPSDRSATNTSSSGTPATVQTEDEGRPPVYFADHLEVGDCWNDSFSDDGDYDYSGAPDLVDCDSPHDNEVSAVWEIGDPWPGRDALDEQMQQICGEAFSSYTGAEYGTSAVDGFSLWPEQDEWEAGGHRGACIVYVDMVAVAGSLEGIGTGARPFDFPVDAPIPDAAVLQRAGRTDEGDRLLAFDVAGAPEDVVVAVLAAADAAGWDQGDVGAASRTTVMEFTTDGDLHTITVSAPEGDGPVEIAYFYPAAER